MGRFPACGQPWRSTRRYSNAVPRPLYVQNAAASRVGKTRLAIAFFVPKTQRCTREGGAHRRAGAASENSEIAIHKTILESGMAVC